MNGPVNEGMRSRASGCILGQLCGDALGSLVEFQKPEKIRRDYPNGVREMHDGGTWNTIAGQPTDDSEMALALARSIISEGKYIQDSARTAYETWFASKPFDFGNTVYRGINYDPDHASQANGALMRVSPLGIFGSRFSGELVGKIAEQDAIITHPNPICRQINNLFTRALSQAIAYGSDPQEIYKNILIWAEELDVDFMVRKALVDAKTERPRDFITQQGWVLIAFQNAVFQLLHASSLEECLVDTISQGGDTDTNAAIAGALIGALEGESSVPQRWRQTLLLCRPEDGDPRVFRPRPAIYWPIDATEVAGRLLEA